MRVIDWRDFISGGPADRQLSLSIGVFDGVHRGHQALIARICTPSSLSTVITFRQNPLRCLNPGVYQGDIFSLDQKLAALESLGVMQTVLIDFSGEFSRMSGNDFIGALKRNNRIDSIVLGVNFRCGRGLDTGIEEIRGLTEKERIQILTVDPVMEGAQAVSSSRIRTAVSKGDLAAAAGLLGRNPEIDLSGFPVNVLSGKDGKFLAYDTKDSGRIIPPAGHYRGKSPEGEAVITVENGTIIVPANSGPYEFNSQSLEFITD